MPAGWCRLTAKQVLRSCDRQVAPGHTVAEVGVRAQRVLHESRDGNRERQQPAATPIRPLPGRGGRRGRVDEPRDERRQRRERQRHLGGFLRRVPDVDELVAAGQRARSRPHDPCGDVTRKRSIDSMSCEGLVVLFGCGRRRPVGFRPAPRTATRNTDPAPFGDGFPFAPDQGGQITLAGPAQAARLLCRRAARAPEHRRCRRWHVLAASSCS